VSAEETAENSAPRRHGRRRLTRATLLLCLGLVVAAAGLVVWKGPSSALRWAVRMWDPALRLHTGSLAWRDGEVVLRKIELHFRGRPEPIFRARELRAGFGPHWRQGRFGSLVLEEPALSLDRRVLDHFTPDGARGEEGALVPWEFGRVEIRRGHFWLEEFGEPAMDISCNLDAVLESVGPGAPDAEHAFDLSGVYVAVRQNGSPVPLFGAGQATARATIGGLTERRLAGLRVDRGWLLAGPGLQGLAAPAGNGATPVPAVAPEPFVFQSIDLVDLLISTGETAPGVPEMSFKVNTALRDVALGSVASDLAEKIHQVEFADIDILSPFDPLQRAVTVRTLFAKFSLAGLARQEVEELIVLGPTIYAGEALFEYMAQSDDGDQPPPEPVEATEGWKVKTLEVNFGKLVIAAGGRQQVGLPLAFQTKAANVSLSSLAGLNLDLVLTIPPDDYRFPAYDLEFRNVRGDLRLNYPPDEDENNLVNVVNFDRARWRNFTGRNLWVSVTFDLEGINGQFGGETYEGYVTGGFSFLLQPEAPWTGWLAATDVDLAGLTQAVAPQHVIMTGKADCKLEVNGRGPTIERVLGNVHARRRGTLAVNKLNDMIGAIPPEWNALKQELTRVGLETLRDFDYTEAGGDFWFVGRQGLLNVKMKGPSGSRNIEFVLHGDGTGDGVWSQGGR
jgi:hypothetical protein